MSTERRYWACPACYDHDKRESTGLVDGKPCPTCNGTGATGETLPMQTRPAMTTEDRQRADMYPVLMSLLSEWYTTSDAQGDPEHDTALAESTRRVLQYDSPQDTMRTTAHRIKMYPRLVWALHRALHIADHCFDDGDEVQAMEVYREIRELLEECESPYGQVQLRGKP